MGWSLCNAVTSMVAHIRTAKRRYPNHTDHHGVRVLWSPMTRWYVCLIGHGRSLLVTNETIQSASSPVGSTDTETTGTSSTTRRWDK